MLGSRSRDELPTFTDTFGPFFNNEAYSDVVVVLHSKDDAEDAMRVPSHRILLCAQSPMLRKMVDDSLARAASTGSAEVPEVHIAGVDPWIGQTVLRTLYTQDASHLVDDVHAMMLERFGDAMTTGAVDERAIAEMGFVLRVLAASRRLGIKALEIACYRSVQAATNDTTVARILAAAVRDGDEWLTNKSIDFMAGMSEGAFRIAVNRLRPHDEEGNAGDALDFSGGADDADADGGGFNPALDESLGDEHIEVAAGHARRFWIDAETCAAIFRRKFQENPVLLAVELRRPDVLAVLLDGGEPKDTLAPSGKSPLQVAIELPTELTELAAARGADSIAFRGLRASLIALLLSVGGGAKAMLARIAVGLPAERVGGNILHLSVLLNDVVTTTLLLEAGADVNLVDNAMSTALHVAVHIGAEDIVQVCS